MNIIAKDWRVKILTLFLADKTALKFVLGYIAVFCAIGCFSGTPAPDNYILLKNFSPMWVWGCGYTLLAIGHLGCGAKLLSEELDAFTSMLGIWLWSYVIASFVITDKTPFAPFELVTIGILCGELWLLTHGLFFHKGDWSKRWFH